ncbi:hypothetical protein [Streptomyces avermitilis]|uniref:hypothetical protein n=1 Tax=Streptomyces avermitilis TaxID=33903 RepID=UPI0033C6788F
MVLPHRPPPPRGRHAARANSRQAHTQNGTIPHDSTAKPVPDAEAHRPRKATGASTHVGPAATNRRRSLTDHSFAQTLFTQGRGNATVQGPHLSGRAINEIGKKRASAQQPEGHQPPLQAGPDTDTKRTKVPIADRREVGDWGEKSPLPGSRFNRPDDTVDATETVLLDVVPLFGRFKENLGVKARVRDVCVNVCTGAYWVHG